MKNELQRVCAQMNMSDVTAKVRECVDLANAHFNRNIPRPTVSLDLRGVVAGRAYYFQNHIKINPVFLRENPEDMLNQTVPHEVAHLVAHHLYGRSFIKPHGREWKAIMVVLGAKPQTCHSYDVTNARAWKQRRWTYTCNCMEHKLTTTRHNKAKRNQILRGNSGYVCRKCDTHPAWKGTPKLQLGATLKEVKADWKHRQAAEKPTQKSTSQKTWSPKPGSKGAIALDIYQDILWMEDRLIVDYLMKRMNIKKANARAYLAKCKKA